jgi:hypothetical protein
VLKKRDRIINFRVTQDEFVRLRDASLGNGARCLSDYARTAILHAVEGCYDEASGRDRYKDQIHLLEDRLGNVERSILRLESLLNRRSASERQEIGLGAGA